MNHLSKHLHPTTISQTEQARTDQVKNHAGGYVFEVNDWINLDRFLIVGTDGTYYASERETTVKAAEAVKRCLNENPVRFIDRVVEVSVKRLAPKNIYALYALALAINHSLTPVRKYALDKLPDVARTGTDLFQIVEFIKGMRGFGRAVRNGISQWYNQKNPQDLSYQLAKYRQRNGWTHHDILHLCHAKPVSEAHNAAFKWAKDGSGTHEELTFINHQDTLAKLESPQASVRYIQSHKGISWEMVNTEHLSSPDVWKALLPDMPLMALTRNLARMTANGTIKPMSEEEAFVCKRLTNQEEIRRAGLHPLKTLLAMRTYAAGQGQRGSLTWTPNHNVLSALEQAIEYGFHTAEPTGKRIMYALDISGSMGSPRLMNGQLAPSDVTGILSRTLVGTEEKCMVMGFSRQFVPLPIRKTMSMQEAVRTVVSSTFGSTDCAQPMLYALERGLEIDAFVVMTDNETWAGRMHPYQALQEYRKQTGINAKMIVLAMAQNNFSIADPNDPGMLDIAGFSADVIDVMNSFIKM